VNRFGGGDGGSGNVFGGIFFGRGSGAFAPMLTNLSLQDHPPVMAVSLAHNQERAKHSPHEP
jgi:hypothetical protein